jgi:hypothetical protein
MVLHLGYRVVTDSLKSRIMAVGGAAVYCPGSGRNLFSSEIRRLGSGKMATSDVALEPATKIDTDIDTEAAAEEMCVACGHPVRIHDAIGSRFCAATTAGGLAPRGCVCHP